MNNNQMKYQKVIIYDSKGYIYIDMVFIFGLH